MVLVPKLEHGPRSLHITQGAVAMPSFFLRQLDDVVLQIGTELHSHHNKSFETAGGVDEELVEVMMQKQMIQARASHLSELQRIIAEARPDSRPKGHEARKERANRRRAPKTLDEGLVGACGVSEPAALDADFILPGTEFAKTGDVPSSFQDRSVPKGAPLCRLSQISQPEVAAETVDIDHLTGERVVQALRDTEALYEEVLEARRSAMNWRRTCAEAETLHSVTQRMLRNLEEKEKAGGVFSFAAATQDVLQALIHGQATQHRFMCLVAGSDEAPCGNASDAVKLAVAACNSLEISGFQLECMEAKDERGVAGYRMATLRALQTTLDAQTRLHDAFSAIVADERVGAALAKARDILKLLQDAPLRDLGRGVNLEQAVIPDASVASFFHAVWEAQVLQQLLLDALAVPGEDELCRDARVGQDVTRVALETLATQSGAAVGSEPLALRPVVRPTQSRVQVAESTFGVTAAHVGVLYPLLETLGLQQEVIKGLIDEVAASQVIQALETTRAAFRTLQAAILVLDGSAFPAARHDAQDVYRVAGVQAANLRTLRTVLDVHALHQRALEQNVRPTKLAEGAADALAHARNALLALSDCITAGNTQSFVTCESVSARTLEAVVQLQFLQQRLISGMTDASPLRVPVEEASAMHEKTQKALELLAASGSLREVHGRTQTAEIDSAALGPTSVPLNALKDVGNQMFHRSHVGVELPLSKPPDATRPFQGGHGAGLLHHGLRADAVELPLIMPSDGLKLLNQTVPTHHGISGSPVWQRPALEVDSVGWAGVHSPSTAVALNPRNSSFLDAQRTPSDAVTGHRENQVALSDVAGSGRVQGGEPWPIAQSCTVGRLTMTTVEALEQPTSSAVQKPERDASMFRWSLDSATTPSDAVKVLLTRQRHRLERVPRSDLSDSELQNRIRVALDSLAAESRLRERTSTDRMSRDSKHELRIQTSMATTHAMHTLLDALLAQQHLAGGRENSLADRERLSKAAQLSSQAANDLLRFERNRSSIDDARGPGHGVVEAFDDDLRPIVADMLEAQMLLETVTDDFIDAVPQQPVLRRGTRVSVEETPEDVLTKERCSVIENRLDEALGLVVVPPTPRVVRPHLQRMAQGGARREALGGSNIPPQRRERADVGFRVESLPVGERQPLHSDRPSDLVLRARSRASNAAVSAFFSESSTAETSFSRATARSIALDLRKVRRSQQNVLSSATYTETSHEEYEDDLDALVSQGSSHRGERHLSLEYRFVDESDIRRPYLSEFVEGFVSEAEEAKVQAREVHVSSIATQLKSAVPSSRGLHSGIHRYTDRHKVEAARVRTAATLQASVRNLENLRKTESGRVAQYVSMLLDDLHDDLRLLRLASPLDDVPGTLVGTLAEALATGLSRVWDEGFSPMHWASQNGRRDVMEFLLTLDGGQALMNARDTEGKTPLAHAKGRSPVLMSWMRSVGATEPPRVWPFPRPDLRAAAAYLPVFEQIETYGWHSLSWGNGYTVLHWAAESGFADICEYLIALGADVSHIDAFGRTALDCAQEVDEREVVALFNEHMEAIPSMACLTMTTAPGLAQPRRSRKRTSVFTGRGYASSSGASSIVLEDRSIPQAYIDIINRVDRVGWKKMTWKNGFTLLHWAAKHDRPDLCAYFMVQGAEATEKDDTGKDALEYAREFGAYSALDVLENEAPPELPRLLGLVVSHNPRNTLVVSVTDPPSDSSSSS